MKDDFKPRALRIFSYTTNKTILHLEDCLEIGKIAFDAYTYERGRGASGNHRCYIDLADARVLAHQITTSTLIEPWTDYKGSPNKATGEIVSRVFHIEPTDASTRTQGYRIICASGPGKTMPNGAVQPLGKLDKIPVLLPAREALAMALALAEHLQAWTILTYWNRKSETWKPEENNG